MEKLRKFPKIPESIPQRCFYAFGPFHVDPVKRLLLRGAEPISLSPKDFDLLLALVQHRGEVLVKEELLDSVWPDTVVEEGNLNRHISTLRKTLGESPNEHEYIVTVPGRGYRFVGDVRIRPVDHGIAPASAARTRSAPADFQSHLPQPLSAIATALPAAAASLPARLSRRVLLIVLGSVVILCVISLFAVYFFRSKAGVSIHPRRSIAVLGFKNLSGRSDQAWLSTALSEMLTTELAAGEQLRTVPGENVAQMKLNLSLPDADSYGQDTLARIHKNLNADDIILGSYIPLGQGQIRLDLRLQDAVEGETLIAVSEKGSEEQIDDLVSRAGATLRAKLGVAAVSQVQALAIKASLPSNPEAARLYAEGLAKMRAYENLSARGLLEKAVAAEPNFALAHSALAAAWQNLGYDAKAREEAKKAFDLSATLGNEDRLWIEAHYREMADEPDKAVQTYRILFQSYPDNLEYGLRLAYAQYRTTKGQDSLSTVARLRKLPSPARDDPRIDVLEGSAANTIGDYKRYQAATARGAEKARAEGARLLEARALIENCWALKILGQPKEARTACEEAQRIFTGAGDRAYAAAALSQVAVILSEQGDLAAAKAKFEEALATSREVGDRSSTASDIGNIAIILHSQGDLTGAEKMFEQILGIYRELGNRDYVSLSLGNIGGLLADLGDLSGAKARLEESLAIAREIGDKGQEATDLANLADVFYYQGDLSGAISNLAHSEPILRQAGDKQDDSYALGIWGKILSAQGDLVGARAKYQDALNIRNDTAARGTVAQSKLALADLATEEDRPAEAETPCRQAIEEFQSEKTTDDLISAHAVLARTLFAMGKAAEAKNEVEIAGELAAKSQNFGVHLQLSIVSARIRATLHNPSEAAKSLDVALMHSKKHGFVPYEFESRLALGEIERKSGKTASGRARLAALQRDATAKGFLLIARKAVAAAGLPPLAGPHPPEKH
jgi:DNA-binding winged helix-turn-helix (wHTH) protein/tetratricopeptide (TPR) repeat protein